MEPTTTYEVNGDIITATTVTQTVVTYRKSELEATVVRLTAQITSRQQQVQAMLDAIQEAIDDAQTLISKFNQ